MDEIIVRVARALPNVARLRLLTAMALTCFCPTSTVCSFGNVNEVAFSRDGKTLAIAAIRLSLIDCDTMRVLWESDAHTSAVRGVAFSPRGEVPATGKTIQAAVPIEHPEEGQGLPSLVEKNLIVEPKRQ